MVVDANRSPAFGAPDVAPRRTARIRVKASAYIRYGQSGTVTVYAGAPGSETSTGQTLTAYAVYHSIAAGVWAEAYECGGYMFVAHPEIGWLGRTHTAINKDASGTIDIIAGSSAGSETTTGDTITAYNYWGNIASGKRVWCRVVDGKIAIVDAECV